MAVRKAVNCLYECTDPASCPWPHNKCSHCKAVRVEAGWEQPSHDEVLAAKPTWTERHPGGHSVAQA